jgi:hypothetical protein
VVSAPEAEPERGAVKALAAIPITMAMTAKIETLIFFIKCFLKINNDNTVSEHFIKLRLK